jgi:tetratricopeptide (TPR) repeat protein
MRTIPFVDWIANAAARWVGPRGAVTEKAQATGCSRQCVYDHAQKVLAAVQAEHNGGPTREELIQQNDTHRRENAQLWDWLCQTIEFPVAKQQQFAVTALAMGLSLNQTLVLLTLLLGTAAAPSRSRVHRWVQAASKAAGAVLQRLDQAAKTLVVVGCLDEIFFHRRPVLVGVEPMSMVWFLGIKAENCQGSTWSAALQPWSALQYVVSDAGSGLQAGIAPMQQDRRQNQQVPLDNGLDVFHTQQEAQRVLKVLWSRVEGLWEQAEAASRAVAAAQQQGRDARGLSRHATVAWRKAAGAFQRYEQAESAWKRAALALNLFRPDGQLNDRSWAEAEIAAALPGLSDAVWSKVRRFLEAEAALTFLDRMHGRLARLGLSEELRAALVRLWWLRRQSPRRPNPQTLGGYRAVAPLVQQLLCQRLDPNWQASYRRVAAVLRQTVRASSAVECMNSVLRMHQSRHRTLNQDLLDLKRLYWNTRVFRGGKRQGRCPYEHLGLDLPRRDFWGLLQDEMSTAVDQANEPAIAA